MLLDSSTAPYFTHPSPSWNLIVGLSRIKIKKMGDLNWVLDFRKWGLLQNWSVPNIDKRLLSELILGPNQGFLNWILTEFQELKMCQNLAIRRKIVSVWCWVQIGSCGNEKSWQGSLVEGLRRECGKGIFTVAQPHIPFQGKCLPP